MVKKTSRPAKKAAKQEPAPPPRTSFFELFIRFWVTVGLVGIILYVGLLAMARTEGFRHLLAEHLETVLGLPIRIENSRFDWDLNLRLVNLEGAQGLGKASKSQEPEPAARLKAESIYIDWKLVREGYRPGAKVRFLEAEGIQVDLVENLTGEWHPAFLMPIADLPEAIDVERFQESLDKFLDRFKGLTSIQDGHSAGSFRSFTIRDAEFRWIRRNGKYWAGGENVSLQVNPLQVTGREMAHYKFSSDSVLLPGGKQLTDLSFEVMHSDERLLVLEEGLASSKKSWIKRMFDPQKSPVKDAPMPATRPEEPVVPPPASPPARPAAPESAPPVDPLQESIRQSLEEAVTN